MKFFKLISSNKAAVAGSVGTAVMTVGSSLPAFATAPTIPSSVVVTTESLTPLVDGVSANIAIILPIGIALFAIMLGISLVPKIIRKFF